MYGKKDLMRLVFRKITFRLAIGKNVLTQELRCLEIWLLSKPKWDNIIIKSFFGSVKTGLEHVLVFL